MTNAYHAAEEEQYGPVSGAAAARGAMLIALAVVIGLILLAWALDDPGTVVTQAEDTPAATDTTGDDTNGAATDDTGDAAGDTSGDAGNAEAPVITEPDEDTPAETIPPVDEPTGEPRPPAEVNILVANGTSGRGVAGAVSDKLKARGYISNAANATPTDAGAIYYREGYADDARAVQTILGATPDVIQPMPDGSAGVASNAVDDGRLAAANVVVIIGENGSIPFG